MYAKKEPKKSVASFFPEANPGNIEIKENVLYKISPKLSLICTPHPVLGTTLALMNHNNKTPVAYLSLLDQNIYKGIAKNIHDTQLLIAYLKTLEDNSPALDIAKYIEEDIAQPSIGCGLM